MSRMDHVVLAMHGVLLASDCSVQTAGLGYVCCAGHVHAIQKALLDACKAMCFCWPGQVQQRHSCHSQLTPHGKQQNPTATAACLMAHELLSTGGSAGLQPTGSLCSTDLTYMNWLCTMLLQVSACW